MTYEEYRRELNEALEKADWMNPRDKNGPAYRVLARAARDKALPLGKGAARKQKELQIRMAVNNAATLEWRVYAAACAEVLGFGAKRLNDLHKAVLENFRQLSAWAIEDGVDVALERFCRCARDAYKTDVQVEDIPDAQALHQQQRQTRQALDGLAERAWMVEASRKRVGCLPLAPAEVEKRIQTVLQAPAMPESWERRRAR